MSHISYSELKEWTTCPWKHKLNYIDKIKQFKGNEHTAFGSALHTVCEVVVEDFDKNKKSQGLEELFEHEFVKNLQSIKKSTPDIEFNANLIADMRKQGKHLIQFILPALKKYFGKFEMVSVEEPLYEIIENKNIQKKFKGFIDLVVYTPDTKKFHIIDWKTCSWGWDSRKKTDKMITYQLTLYKNFWAKKHGKDFKDITTHFALLKRTAKKNNVELFKVTNGEKKIGNALKLLNKAVYNIDKCNHVKNRLSCYGKYGVCEYYKTEYCS
jgi:hypothetical protein|tara:strand:- start:19440 stop:20246 length:807 start_codon:yes stop_codon:yes gene_type:complete